MRLISFIFLLTLFLSCATTKNATLKSNPLHGTWSPIKQEMGGKLLPTAAFQNQKLTINDSIYIFSAESIDKGVLKYKDNKMDIYGEEGVNIGKHFTALYKFENELLTICYNLSGKDYPETFETKGKPLYFLSVYKKESLK